MAVAAPGRAEERPRLRYDTAIDGPVVLTGGALWITSELLKGALASRACRWCDRSANGGDSLNGVDASVRNALKAEPTDAAEVASNVLGFAALPALTLGTDALVARRDGRASEWPADALVIIEAAILAADLNQAAKFAFGRERPFVHALAADQKGATAHPSDNNVSFFSGHTTLAFALATATGTVATMRDYRAAPAVWAIGMPLAALTGYLRIAADKHYFTDVLAGAVVGGTMGALVPYLLHRPRGEVAVAPTSGGGVPAMSVGGAF
jgi:membrane-associated phospholipid phosphatase